MLPDLDTAAVLPEPYEIMELADGGSAVIRPVKGEVGKMFIHPRDGRPAKWIIAVRLHVSPADKPTLPRYWDLTAKHLVAGILPYVEQMGKKLWEFRIAKFGVDPKSRFSLEAAPLP